MKLLRNQNGTNIDGGNMVVKKPKITEELPEGLTIHKPRRPRVLKDAPYDTYHRGRRYTAERCDDKEIPVEAGKIYYGGEIDTSKAIKDVEDILARKGVKL